MNPKQAYNHLPVIFNSMMNLFETCFSFVKGLLQLASHLLISVISVAVTTSEAS